MSAAKEPLAEQEKTPPRKLDRLIAQLARLGARTDVKAWQRKAESVVGQIARTLRPDTKVAYYVLFGINQHNPGKYLHRPNVQRHDAFTFDIIRKTHFALGELGYCRGIKAPKENDVGSWHVVLDAALRETETGSKKAAVSRRPALRSRQPWRHVHRETLIREVIAKADLVGCAAIVGMPGAGKSILARQVAEQLRHQARFVLEFDATRWLGIGMRSRLSVEGLYDGLFAEISASVAELCLRQNFIPRSQNQFEAEMPRLRATLLERCSNAYENQSQVTSQKLLTALGARDNWQRFIKAVATYGRKCVDRDILVQWAAILRLALEDVVVLIDGVREFDLARPLVNGWFKDDAPNTGGLAKLIVTSTQKTSLSFLDVGAAIDIDTSSSVDLSDDALGFARLVVSAWALRDPGDVPEITRLIAKFFSERIENNTKIRDGLDVVTEKVGGNPLALAAIGSSWRSSNYDEDFFRDVAYSLEHNAEEVLTVGRHNASEIDSRHANVISALRFGWMTLEPESRERYLDLAISPETEPICNELFKVVWRRLPRGKLNLPSSLTFQKLADNSLIQRIGGSDDQYVLHILHRSMIEVELKSRRDTALGERHRDLFRALGFLNEKGALYLDEKEHFDLVDDQRTILRPKLHDDATERDTIIIGRYLLKHILVHVRSAGDGREPEDRLSKAVISYRLLQSLIDVHDSSGGRTPTVGGNIDNLLAFLKRIRSKTARQLYFFAASCSSILFLDRHQLPGQLVGSFPTRSLMGLQKLRRSVRRYAPKPVLIPRFPFMSERSVLKFPYLQNHSTVELRYKNPDFVRLKMSWAADPSGNLVVIVRLTDGTVLSWDPASGRDVASRFVEHGDLKTEAWTSDRPLRDLALSWRGDDGWAWNSGVRVDKPVAAFIHRDELSYGRHFNDDGVLTVYLAHRKIYVFDNTREKELCSFECEHVCEAIRLIPTISPGNVAFAVFLSNCTFATFDLMMQNES